MFIYVCMYVYKQANYIVQNINLKCVSNIIILPVFHPLPKMWAGNSRQKVYFQITNQI